MFNCSCNLIKLFEYFSFDNEKVLKRNTFNQSISKSTNKLSFINNNSVKATKINKQVFDCSYRLLTKKYVKICFLLIALLVTINNFIFLSHITKKSDPFIFANAINLPTSYLETLKKLTKKISPFHELNSDAFADPEESIRARHFEAETHYVKTKDNYIITIHRIVNPLVPNYLRPLLKPVILQHGLLTSSYNFIIGSDINRDRPKFSQADLYREHPLHVYTPLAPFSWQQILTLINDLTLAKLGLTEHSDRLSPNGQSRISDALAFSLANEAYDVWMPNSRGSTYSLNHTIYDSSLDWQYWDFSFHEMALYDLPACIDYVLAKRNRNSLAYVGHSQGNLIMFVLQSYYPELYARKVKPFIALAPVAFLPNVYFGLPRVILNLISPVITPRRLNELVKGQVAPKSAITAAKLDFVCLPKWTEPICDLMLTLMLGNNFFRANRTLTPIIAHHIPEGTSVLNMLHFGSLMKTGQFRTFDFGPTENMRRYGNTINPFYKIQDIVSPDIAFISGKTDILATMTNVENTRSMLNVKLIDDYVVPDKFWGHADYMYAIGSGKLVNIHIIGLIDRYRLID